MAARQAEGILDYGSSNQIGGPVPAAGNLISANNWGVRLDGSSATANLARATCSAPTSPARHRWPTK